MAAQQTIGLTPAWLVLYENRIVTAKWDQPAEVIDVLLLSAVHGVKLKTRWHAVNDVTLSTQSGEREYGLFDQEAAKRFHGLIAEQLARRR